MRALITALGLGLAMVSSALAQAKPAAPAAPAPRDSVAKSTSSTHYSDALKSLPAGVAEKIAAARDAAKAAKADVDAMKAKGKTPADIEAMIAEKKASALLNLQKALDALNDLPDVSKQRVTTAEANISKRLDERKADAKPAP